MIFGDLGGLKFPNICLTGEEKPHPGNLSRPGIEPGPLRDKRACYHLLHSGGLSPGIEIKLLASPGIEPGPPD